MKIDLEKAKKQFLEYTKTFNLENENIKTKQEHSIRVMEISKEIAKRMNLEQEEIELATLIGLLHDIARFEQYEKYNTFRDSISIDHGDYGVEILEKEIRKYIQNNQYDEIIKKAVKNHNKYEIEKGLTEKEMLFAKIVRDADKIDIFYESVQIFWKGKEEVVENSTTTKEIVEQIKQEKQIKRNGEIKPEHAINKIISVIGFIFNINFRETFEILKENDYINEILDRYNIKDKYTKQAVDEIRQKTNLYIEQKIEKYEG